MNRVDKWLSTVMVLAMLFAIEGLVLNQWMALIIFFLISMFCASLLVDRHNLRKGKNARQP